MTALSLPDTVDLNQRVILITGAGDGIGRAVALECGKAGATVILLGKTTRKLEQVYDELVELGAPEPAIYPLDLEGAGADDYLDLQAVIRKTFGKLDGLFNNAGWLGASMPMEQYDIELWYKVMQINLNGPFMLTQACIPLLKQADKGRIVFNADNKQTAYWGAYGVAKAAQSSMMKILADELDTAGIRVNAFDPQAVRTNFRTRAYPAENPENLPLPKDVAHYYAALLSAQIDFNGQTLTVNDLDDKN